MERMDLDRALVRENGIETALALTARLGIRELVDQYAHCADTRNAAGQMALFTSDTQFLVYYEPKSGKPSQVVDSRDGLRPVFDALNAYDATMHFNGQTTVTDLGHEKLRDGPLRTPWKRGRLTATAITYCMAHHLTVKDGKQHFMVAAIRYHDVMVQENEGWLFAERKLFVDWIENR